MAGAARRDAPASNSLNEAAVAASSDFLLFLLIFSGGGLFRQC